MKHYAYPQDQPPRLPRALALGVFEGLHIGHRAVICQAAGRSGLTAAVFTFAGRLPKGEGGALLTAERRDALLTDMGGEETITADFEAIRDLSPEAFVRDVLREQLDVRLVTCGFNFRFGKNGAGTVDTLRTLGAAHGIEVIAVPAVEVDGQAVSTSRIRLCLQAGDMPLANRLLGVPFTLDFPVGAAAGGAHHQPAAARRICAAPVWGVCRRRGGGGAGHLWRDQYRGQAHRGSRFSTGGNMDPHIRGRFVRSAGAGDPYPLFAGGNRV